MVLSCTFAGTCYAEDPVLWPHCNGTGKYTCSIYGGDGVLTCKGCNWAGIVDATDRTKVACIVCQGTGEMDCTDSNCVISRESNGMCPYCQGCGYVDSFTGGAATGGTVIGGSSSSNTQGGIDNTDDANSILNGGGSSQNKQQNDGKLKLNQNNSTQYVDLLDGNTEEGKANQL